MAEETNSSWPVSAVQDFHQILEPDVDFMYSPIEDVEAGRTHLTLLSLPEQLQFWRHVVLDSAA